MSFAEPYCYTLPLYLCLSFLSFDFHEMMLLPSLVIAYQIHRLHIFFAAFMQV